MIGVEDDKSGRAKLRVARANGHDVNSADISTRSEIPSIAPALVTATCGSTDKGGVFSSPHLIHSFR